MEKSKENQPNKKVHVSKISRANKSMKYPKVDLGHGDGKLSIETHLNNIWKSIDSVEINIMNIGEKLIEDQILERLKKIEKELKHIKKASCTKQKVKRSKSADLAQSKLYYDSSSSSDTLSESESDSDFSDSSADSGVEVHITKEKIV